MTKVTRSFAFFLLLALAACGDGGGDSPAGPAAPGGGPSFDLRPAALDADDIRDAIEALFPAPGLRHAALTRFGNVERQLDRGEVADARRKTLDLAAFTLDHLANARLLDPNGAADPTTAGGVAELVAALYAFVGLVSPPPVQVHSGDGGDVVAIVGSGGGTVTTEGAHAGVAIPDASIDETTLITIRRLERDPCLPTGLEQFEGCYEFEKTPATDFAAEVTVGVCVDPAVLDEPVYDRLLLHRFDPDDPDAGVIPLENTAAPFLDCSAFTAAASDAPAPWRLAVAGWDRLKEWLAPPLHAAHLGAGGFTISFSDIGWAAPPELAFTSDRDGDPDVYISNPDGHGFLDLTGDPAADLNPKWSPDESRIVFGSERDADLEVYIMNADGSGPTRITNSPGYDLAHSWSPDGTKLAFTTDRTGPREVWIMDADGSDARALASPAGSPDFSPIGPRMLFESTDFLFDGGLDVFVVDLDGTDLVNLSLDPTDAARPAWSPDGNRIAFSSARDGNFEIYVMDADGGDQRRLTHAAGADLDPAWSPDGTRIAFASNRTGDFEIYVVNAADGGGLTRVTVDPAADQHPDWRPVP